MIIPDSQQGVNEGVVCFFFDMTSLKACIAMYMHIPNTQRRDTLY